MEGGDVQVLHRPGAAKVTDVIGLYLAPPENAIVLCVDEKSQIQGGVRWLCKRVHRQGARVPESETP